MNRLLALSALALLACGGSPNEPTTNPDPCMVSLQPGCPGYVAPNQPPALDAGQPPVPPAPTPDAGLPPPAPDAGQPPPPPPPPPDPDAGQPPPVDAGTPDAGQPPPPPPPADAGITVDISGCIGPDVVATGMRDGGVDGIYFRDVGSCAGTYGSKFTVPNRVQLQPGTWKLTVELGTGFEVPDKGGTTVTSVPVSFVPSWESGQSWYTASNLLPGGFTAPTPSGYVDSITVPEGGGYLTVAILQPAMEWALYGFNGTLTVTAFSTP